jgi:hypothetical protein
MLGVNVVCGETEKEALRVQAAGELAQRLAAEGSRALFPLHASFPSGASS